MKAEIISIGTELLLGEITDTNAVYLASQLPLLGLDLHFIYTAGDNKQRLIDTLNQSWQKADIIITTGGLGPTEDDITREAIAEFFGEELTIDTDLAQEIESIFCKYGFKMSPNNMKQAMVIPSAQPIPGKGTAPGWWIERDGRIIITMPGPPREMESMWSKQVFPRLQQNRGDTIIASKTLKTFGLGESRVDELVRAFLTKSNPSLGIYARADGIQLRITAKANKLDKAQEMIAETEVSIRAVLDKYIWGVDSDRIENVVGTLLTAKGLSLATMEAGTGGFLSNIITNDPESSRYFKGGLVVYSDEAKIDTGIDRQLVTGFGSASAEVAEDMATIARERLGAIVGIGIAGNIKLLEAEDKSLNNIFIGIDNGKIRQSFARSYPGNRLQVKRLVAISALFQLRKMLITQS